MNTNGEPDSPAFNRRDTPKKQIIPILESQTKISVMSKAHAENQKAFEEILERLNPKQRIAVDTIDGPVMVIAGPGSGKTQLLAARIGNILTSTDTGPENILCLTFTDAAAVEMRDRLKTLIGPIAHKIHIFTFHSFCNYVIQENYFLFGKQDLQAVSELEQFEIVRKILDKLDVYSPLKQSGNPYQEEGKILGLIQTMKKEGWTPEYINDAVEKYMADLPLREKFLYKRKYKEFQKGDVKINDVRIEKRKMDKLIAAAALLPLYKAEMQELNRFDFADMILWVIAEFKKNPELVQRYQEQYHYFLIDEFQDTNGAQNEIVQLLSSYWDAPNVFIVGDDDQSIFEFQGARIKNTTDFYEENLDYIKVVCLEENYRSSQTILDASNILIKHNTNRLINNLKALDLTKELTARNPDYADTKLKPTLLNFQDKNQEDVYIVQQIKELHAQGIAYQDIAILYTKHKQGANIMDLLVKDNIPINTKKKINILEHPLIKKVKLLFEYIEKEDAEPYEGEALLFKLLHFDFLHFDYSDLAKLQFHFASLDRNEDGRYWRKIIADEALLKELKIASPNILLDFSKLIEMLIAKSKEYSLSEFVQKLINECGLLKYISTHQKKYEYVQVLYSFYQFVEEESLRDHTLDLAELNNLIDRMVELGLGIDMHQIIGAGEGVNLMTAYASKGLEFRVVFMIDCSKKGWDPGRTGNYNFSFPDTLTFSTEEDLNESKRRLFYVAMTRAKEQLYFTYSRQEEGGKKNNTSQYLDEILQGDWVTTKDIESKEEDMSEALFMRLTQLPKDNMLDNKSMSKLLENFTLSASSFNAYLECPLRFYYENVLRVPGFSSEAAAYGTALHDAMYKYFAKMMEDPKNEFGDVGQLLKFFEIEMFKRKGLFSESGYKFRLDKGVKNITDLYKQQVSSWPKNVKLEMKIDSVDFEGVIMRGYLDRVDIISPTQAEIVDYKTGSTTNMKSKVGGPTKAYPEGKSYWRQLIFYKILLENSRDSQYNVQAAKIASLEPNDKDHFDEFTVKIASEDEQLVGGLIKETWANIHAHKFDEGCGKPTCHWCNFANDHLTMVYEMDDMLNE